MESQNNSIQQSDQPTNKIKQLRERSKNNSRNTSANQSHLSQTRFKPEDSSKNESYFLHKSIRQTKDNDLRNKSMDQYINKNNKSQQKLLEHIMNKKLLNFSCDYN